MPKAAAVAMAARAEGGRGGGCAVESSPLASPDPLVSRPVLILALTAAVVISMSVSEGGGVVCVCGPLPLALEEEDSATAIVASISHGCKARQSETVFYLIDEDTMRGKRMKPGRWRVRDRQARQSKDRATDSNDCRDPSASER